MIRVAIADDHTLLRKSIALVINSFDGIETVIEAENGRILLEHLESIPADIVLLDIQMPVMDGYEAARLIRSKYPALKILIVSQFITKESVYKCLEIGTHGIFTKNSNPEQLEIAIRDVHTKGIYFDPGLGEVLHEMVFSDKKSVPPTDPIRILSERELEIIRLASRGLDSATIAEKLYIHKRTVDSHRTRIMDKMAVKSFTTVILMAVKYGYVLVEDLCG